MTLRERIAALRWHLIRDDQGEMNQNLDLIERVLEEHQELDLPRSESGVVEWETEA